MNKFRKYRMVKAFVGVRIIERATDPNAANDYRKANDPNRSVCTYGREISRQRI